MKESFKDECIYYKSRVIFSLDMVMLYFMYRSEVLMLWYESTFSVEEC